MYQWYYEKRKHKSVSIGRNIYTHCSMNKQYIEVSIKMRKKKLDDRK